MLVLSRKQKEEIVIGENVTITVLQIKGNTVRLGIAAPRDIGVRRSEIRKEDFQRTEITSKFDNPPAAGPEPATAKEPVDPTAGSVPPSV